MNAQTWLAFAAVGIPGLVSLFVAMRSSSTTKAISDRSASLEEFKQLRAAMREDLNEALKRIDSLEEAVETERTKREEAERRAESAERRADAAERKADHLQQRVTHLEDVLRRHDIDPGEVPTDGR